MSYLRKISAKLLNKNLFLKRKAISIYYSKKEKSYIKEYAEKFPVKENYVFFESFGGAKATCSPRALYDKMVTDEKYDGYTKIWAVNDISLYDDLKEDDRTILVKYDSKLFYRYLAQSKYIIANSRIPDFVIKKDEQVYIQCWHGTPFKRLGYDINPEYGNKQAILTTNEAYDKDAQKYDIVVSPSPFYTEKISSAFNFQKNCPDVKIIEKGYPRNDSLFTSSEEDVKKIKESLNIPKDKKVILYAPTYRDDQIDAGNGYTYDLGLDFEKFKEALSDDYVVLFRAHYYISKNFEFEKYGDFIIDVSSYNNVNNLYLVSDILITDYSSVFFDFENLCKPVIFYMYDYDDYKNKARDFYFDLSILPGPVFFNENDLLNFFKSNKVIVIEQEIYDEFNDKFNPHRGPCSGEVLKEIFMK
ncbi:MAG: CDP-glycerol glycerophosphotransferase family protein [Acutalibacteraceae bacterium]